MGDDEWQRILMSRPNVNEMDVQTIDFGDELREGIQAPLALAPVVFCRPVAREFLHRRELHALRCIATVSRSGHRVAAIRLRRSTRAASGTLTRNGRMALLLLLAAAATVAVTIAATFVA